ncbi:MAG TPA: M56 family metallopeptidase [Verrucomicrobiae bacterium]|nr:M56 family metallopeptidase [Verrucomicrobiae bacterium]
MSNEFFEFCASGILGALNGVIQGLLVAALVAIILRVARGTNAATRHAVWLATLGLVVLMVPAAWLANLPLSRSGSIQGAPAAGSIEPLSPVAGLVSGMSPPSLESDRADFAIPELQSPVESTASSIPSSLLADSSVPPMQDAGAATGREPPLVNVESASDISLFTRVMGSILRPVSWGIYSATAEPVLAVLLATWLAGAAISLGILVRRLRRVKDLARDSRPAGPELQHAFRQLLAGTNTTRNVQLRVSPGHCNPVVLGFAEPVILFPMSLDNGSEEAWHVLSHELAHVRRYDDWVNLGQHFAQALLFFHPAVWWIGKRLSIEREIACDDHVLLMGTARRNYALTLASVAGRIRQQSLLLGPGVSNNRSQLQQRISMILNKRRNSSPRLAKGRTISIIATAAFIAVLALYSAPRLVFADPPKEPQAAPVAPEALAGEPGPTPAPEAIAPVAPVVAETAPSSDTPQGVGDGPKFKSDAGIEPSPVPGPPVPPDPDLVKPKAPRAWRSKAGKAPRLADTADGAVQVDGSIEDRLNRLEKMVRSLMDQQKRSSDMFAFNGMQGKAFPDLDRDRASEQKIKEMAERQATRAADQAKRAVEQAERATRDLEARLQKDPGGMGQTREAFEQQLESLRNAREGLNREMERLTRQIQKLEREKKRANRETQGRGDGAKDDSQAQNGVDPEAKP